MTYSPHDLIPCKEPKEEEFKDIPAFFYYNVIQYLIKDVVRMADAGILLDMQKVEELENVVENVLKEVKIKLAINPLMQKFLAEKNKHLVDKKREELNSKKKEPKDFLKEFNPKNNVHRTYVLNAYFKSIDKLTEFYKEDYSVKDIKAINEYLQSNFITSLLDKTLSSTHEIVLLGMQNLALDKAKIYNSNYDNKKECVTVEDVQKNFNAGSAIQKQELFGFLGIESEEVSKKTGNDSWNKKELEKLLALINSMIEG